MTTDFIQIGVDLIKSGYRVVPIKPNEKRPGISNWQNSCLTAAELQKYKGCGVGVLCGQGEHPIAAIDIDTTNEALALEFTTWCEINLAPTCERVGNAPKRLLVYRAAFEGWGKATGAWFEDGEGKRHRLEILGKGQQFVAYHVHPETKKPYEWVDLLGGIAGHSTEVLPVITETQVQQALAYFEVLAIKHGLTKVVGSKTHIGRSVTECVNSEEDFLLDYTPRSDLSLEETKELLAPIDNTTYDAWINIGMALHFEFEGSDDALMLWYEWGSTYAAHADFEQYKYKWSTFRSNGPNMMGAGWLRKVSREAQQDTHPAEKFELLKDAKEQIKNCSDVFILRDEVAPRLGTLYLGDSLLSIGIENALKERFKELGTVVPLSEIRDAMRAQMKRARREADTEDGNARRLINRFGSKLLIAEDTGVWYWWTGVYWQRSTDIHLERLARDTISALPEELNKISDTREQAEFFKFYMASQQAKMMSNMIRIARSDRRIRITHAELDKYSYLLGVGNGAVDLRTGKLLEPDPKHRITIITSVHFDLQAKAPLFEQTVSDAFFGDKDLIAFFQRLIGYTIMGSPDADILVIPFGDGSNGKSTIFNAIRVALGDHARMAAADTFLSTSTGGSNAGGAREDLIALRGARFVHISEPDEGSELKEGFIKSTTGGEPIKARGLYSSAYISIKPTWTSFLPTNHKPIVKGDDHGIWRRLVLLPFTRNFDEDRNIIKDEKRAEKLAQETEGILAWCVRGALMYQKEGLNYPAQVQEARNEYRNDMDLLAEWIEECCELGPDLIDTSTRLWASWESYSKSRGELRYIQSAKKLGSRLRSKGMKPVERVSGTRGRGWQGIQVKCIGDFEEV